jgi:para-aminobenzoate N-oxygenase AurF
MSISAPSETHEQITSAEVIDFSRLFMPQELTPFYHTPGYVLLSASQRLRYNQLHALYFNEQTMFFEKALARNVLGYFLAQPLPAELKSGLRQFMAEEGQHTAMFRGLNRNCAPELYSQQDFYFIRVPGPAAALLDFISKRPRQFPLLLWLMHLQEERALFFGRTFLKCADSLEPHFVATQRKHVADEIGHLRWDEGLLDWVWPKAGFLRRQFNTRIFAWMIEEYFSTPKRTAVRVLAALIQEFPELRPDYKGFCRQLLELGKDPKYRRSLYCQENVPNTFKRFDAWPEFQPLKGAMPGYIPGANA